MALRHRPFPLKNELRRSDRCLRLDCVPITVWISDFWCQESQAGEARVEAVLGKSHDLLESNNAVAVSHNLLSIFCDL
jgi:hypothetical protein